MYRRYGKTFQDGEVAVLEIDYTFLEGLIKLFNIGNRFACLCRLTTTGPENLYRVFKDDSRSHFVIRAFVMRNDFKVVAR